jgi:hypothetical protein
MRSNLLAGMALALLCGCSDKPFKTASVSGRVTLDGKPLPKASVTFVPMATKENQNPGPTAQGMTDAEGRFKLAVDPSTPGSVVGTCRVYISTLLSDPTDDRDAGGPAKKIKDRVPEKYNKRTELTFTVPPGGTDQANLELVSK